MSLPVCTWSPICRSVIDTVFPLATLTFAVDGKHPFLVVVVVVGWGLKQTLLKQ